MKTPLDSVPALANFLARHAAIIALAVFAIVGVFIVDDYGVGVDSDYQRDNGIASFDYILGDEDALIEGRIDRYFGVAFEVPLIAVERLLRLEDSRDILLSRHIITHLFFLAGGFFAWLLAYRLFGSRLIALIAMLIFLLHPRIYAHSFFNSKDVPFLSMFAIALYLTHRAFRRDTVWAFALCGAGVGLLANIRIMGVILIPAVLGMLALDALYAAKRGYGVKHALVNICAFSTICAATLYAAWPATWRDPLGATEALGLLYRHPLSIHTLFRGELVWWPNIPWDYAPTWILITTPPAALALAAVGIGYAARLCAADWRGALANSTARFGLLALACLILPVAAAIALNSNMFNGWRHVYFLYAPICVLAAFGLRGLAALPKPRLRAAAFALAAVGVAAVAVQMVRIHPHQNEYFSPLLNKSALADRWEMDYWRVSHKAALDALLKIQPSGRVVLLDLSKSSTQINVDRNMKILPKDDRRRLSVNRNFPSYVILHAAGGESALSVVWEREIYGAPFISILDARAESEAAVRAVLAAAGASEPDAGAGGFDIYADGGSVSYIKESCGEEDARGRFSLLAFPVDRNDLPEGALYDGLEYEALDSDFAFSRYGAMLDGKCVIARDLPDYPLSHVETGKFAPDGSRLWSVQIPLAGYRERYERAMSSLTGEPAARGGDFGIWLNGRRLIYSKEGCGEEDARSRISLFAFPVDQSDLTQTARDVGLEYEWLDFDFHIYGMSLDGGCIVVRHLPDYPISHIETGQFTPGESRLWSVKIPLAGYRERYERALSRLSGEPAARSGFDIWLDGDTLTYVKQNCDDADTRGRFFLSIFPADLDDLPQPARDAGHEHQSLNFDFARHGALLDGRCVIIRRLPDYEISRIETGQWVQGEGELWRAGIVVSD